DVLADELHDLVHRRPGIEDAGHAGFLHDLKVLLGDDPADQKQDIVHLVLVEQFIHTRYYGVVRAGENRQTDDVHIFLQRRSDDHLRRLAQAGVDDFHAGVAQRTGNHLGTTIMAIKPWFGDENAYFAVIGHLGEILPNPKIYHGDTEARRKL